MDDLRGKVVLLNLWATWCPPCVEEMPTLEALSKKMTGRDFVLLAISEDEHSEKVAPWIEKRGFDVPGLARRAGAGRREISASPATRRRSSSTAAGRIVHRHIGYRNWAEPGIVAALERLMNTGEWRLG